MIPPLQTKYLIININKNTLMTYLTSFKNNLPKQRLNLYFNLSQICKYKEKNSYGVNPSFTLLYMPFPYPNTLLRPLI